MNPPKVGTIVHYRPAVPEGDPMHGIAMAAIVVYVWTGQESGLLNLAVFDPDGGVHQSLQVPFYDGSHTMLRPKVNFCEWPSDDKPRIHLVS